MSEHERAALVKCYSGHTYAQRPRAFFWQDEEHEIDQVLAEWAHPGGKRFRVSTVAGDRFDLVYEIESDEWQVNLIQ